MSARDTINTIMGLETIDDLASFLQSRPVAQVRRELLDEFDARSEYVDANEWAIAVRICEALAIIGWGSRERVDAISRFNGDCWETKFVTDRDEHRFRFACWSKRKAGWTLWHPQFYASPDFPNRPPIDWTQNAHKTFPIIDRDTLPSQRNYQLQMPIAMGMVGGDNETSKAVVTLWRDLDQLLRDKMTPAAYGDALEKFYFIFRCPFLTTKYEAHLKVGNYNAKQKAFYSDLFFSDDFGLMSRADQRDYIGQSLLRAIDALAAKLQKRKINYDIATFRSHVKDVIDHWGQNDG